MSDEVERAELEKSRGAWIDSLGGANAVAKALGYSNHSTVSMWKKNGFPAKQYGPLRDLAKSKQVEPHPELLQEKKRKPNRTWKYNSTTESAAFIKSLANACNGFVEMSRTSGIPFTSLKRMCEADRGIISLHVPALEIVARVNGVPLPKSWPEIREAYVDYVKKMEIRKKKRKKSLDVDVGGEP